MKQSNYLQFGGVKLRIMILSCYLKADNFFTNLGLSWGYHSMYVWQPLLNIILVIMSYISWIKKKRYLTTSKIYQSLFVNIGQLKSQRSIVDKFLNEVQKEQAKSDPLSCNRIGTLLSGMFFKITYCIVLMKPYSSRSWLAILWFHSATSYL